jgi:hypothetical protein
VAEDRVAPIVARLQEAGLVADAVAKEGIKESRELLLVRSLDNILVSEALEFGGKNDHRLEPNVRQMIYRIEEIEKKALGDLTLLDLLDNAGERTITRAAR